VRVGVVAAGQDVFNRQQPGFKDEERDRPAQPAEERYRKSQQKRGTEDVGQDLAAPLDSVLSSGKVSHLSLFLLAWLCTFKPSLAAGAKGGPRRANALMAATVPFAGFETSTGSPN
jgi:hypothetical protein